MNEPKSARYQRLARRAHVAQVSAGAALLALLALTPAARGLAGVARAATSWLPAALQALAAPAVFIVLLVLLWELLALPAALYLDLHVARRFGRAGERARGLLATQLRAAAVGLAVALLLAAIVAVAARATGSFWWIGAGALSALALAGALRLIPALPLGLDDTRPIARRPLMSGLREIARRSGVPVSDIREWRVADGARATALVTGVGRSRRVLVASEMLRDWTEDEIAVVVAHELAHHVYRDLWRTLALDAVMLSAAFGAAAWTLERWAGPLGLSGPADLAALPLMALVAGAVWLGATPIRFAQSRAQERRADRFALRLTREAAAFGTAVRRLSAKHLAEERPSRLTRWLFHRHPPVAERLAMAERFAASGVISSARPPGYPASIGIRDRS